MFDGGGYLFQQYGFWICLLSTLRCPQTWFSGKFPELVR
jgi:hypothetical protein